MFPNCPPYFFTSKASLGHAHQSTTCQLHYLTAKTTIADVLGSLNISISMHYTNRSLNQKSINISEERGGTRYNLEPPGTPHGSSGRRERVRCLLEELFFNTTSVIMRYLIGNDALLKFIYKRGGCFFPELQTMLFDEVHFTLFIICRISFLT